MVQAQEFCKGQTYTNTQLHSQSRGDVTAPPFTLVFILSTVAETENVKLSDLEAKIWNDIEHSRLCTISVYVCILIKFKPLLL